eukprot:gnl/TRDRNA2_/TRDRNA2_139119_c0_seq2.p1 gnl/TRDRNA2_/TRDRNA2_139119_c0~~gnl/TRDRNA2_/TRDRNA2_139119_c0_seq2.p1  ORF type:complete len:379 (-),score=68.10 gnl/TRDRNA2_/TRDRNA2_139119_c0_seq2:101-1237(-)
MSETLPGEDTGSQDISLTISTVGGRTLDVSVASVALVAEVRRIVEQKLVLPPATYLKLLINGQILKDEMPVSELECSVPLLAAVARETDAEVLLQAAGSYQGYREMLERATVKPEVAGGDTVSGGVAVVGPMPTILAVLEDMCGQAVAWKDGTLRVASAGGSLLEFCGSNGAMLLPSLEASPLLEVLDGASISHVIICAGVNSDSYNRGLGLVVEASPLLDATEDESESRCYLYSGLGYEIENMQDGLEKRRANMVKFHPGMNFGQLRVEGQDGFGNNNVGFTPDNWTDSGQKLHLMELTLGADGKNEVCLINGTPEPGKEPEVWRREWTHKLFDGKHIPSVSAWIDMGGSEGRPLNVGPITLRAQFSKQQAADTSSV